MSSLFTATYVIWFLTEALLNRVLRSKSTDRQHTDKNSLAIIWVTVVLANILAVYIAMNFRFLIYSIPAFHYIGLGIIITGIILRFAAVFSLGAFFTVDVTIREDHKLKRDGMYKYLRHPSYFASLLSFAGFGIALNNWVSLLLIIVSVLTVFTYRIKIEEKLLIEQFGNEYLDYKKSTSGLIPFLY